MTLTDKGKHKSNATHPRCCSSRLMDKARCYLEKLCPLDATPRERILAVACDLFYREGIHAVGVDTIATAAGTNKMTLYRHFGSKDELIAAYLEHIAEDGLKKWAAFSKGYSNEPMQQLVAWIDFAGPSHREMFCRGCAFINAAAELPDPNHPGRKVVEKYKKFFHELTLGLCRKADLTDPEAVADELHLVFEGTVVSAQNLGINGPASRSNALQKLIVEAHTKKS